jgi:hypothetical protein
MVVNDRLRRKAEICGGRTLFPCTGSVYRDRIKIRSDSKVEFSNPYTELYDCRIRSYMVVYGYNMRHFSDSH